MIAYQDTPDALLPPALQNANPLGIERTINGKRTRDRGMNPSAQQSRLALDRIPLNAFDLSVFVVYMVVTVALGFWVAGRHRKTTQGLLPRRPASCRGTSSPRA